jgi:CHAT domain-containing protein/Tfp pilus assembly protein PilF
MHTRRRFVSFALAFVFALVNFAAAGQSTSPPSSPPASPCSRFIAADAVVADGDTIDFIVDCAYEFSDGNDHPTATRVFGLAVDTATRRGDLKGRARALNASANELVTFGDGRGAEALFMESFRLAEQAGDRNGAARAASSLGSLRLSQARYDESLAYHLQSLDIWTAMNSASGMATSLNNVGNAYRALGNYATALEYLQRSLDSLERQGDRRRSATVLDNMGVIARRLGDYGRGLELAQRGLAIRESFNDRAGTAKSLDSLSEVYQAQGNWSAALAALGKSLDIRREFGYSHATAEALNNIAVVYEAQGSYEQAVSHLQQALALNTDKVGSVSLTAEIKTHLGEVFLLEGQLERSTRVLTESVATTEAAGYNEQAANARYALGRTHVARRQFTAARFDFEASLALREALGDRGGRASALIELADLDRRQRLLQRGLDRAEEARQLAVSTEMPDVQWRALTLIGRLQLASANPAGARSSFDAAIALVEDIRGRNPGGEEARSRFFADRLAPFHDRITLAIAEGNPAEALSLAERSKARALLDVLRDKGIGVVTHTVSAEESSRDVALRTSLNSANAELEMAVRTPVPDEARISILRRARDQKRLEYQAFESRLYAEHPELHVSRADLPRISAADARRLVSDHESAIVEFVVGADRTFAIVISPASVRAVALNIGGTDLAREVHQFRDQLGARDLRAVETSRRLHEQILAPVRIMLAGVTNLILIPDGVLWELPFQALQSGTGRYLIEDTAVAYAPSIMVLREMMGLRAGATAARTLLALGNPAGDAQDALPDAETEVRRIAEIYGPSSRVLVGADAREDRWKAEAPNYRVVHLAAHGVLDDASPMYSSLRLASSQTPGAGDGLLEAWEIMNVPLKAELVVFSGCDTARGRVAPGEGILGLMWAGFVAGSQASLVSQWRVDSKTSAALMIAFHEAWNSRAGRMSKAQALQAASISVLRTPGLSHPFNWAGFILAGDGR